VIDALPEADTAALAFEFVATPQPRSTVLFPWKVIPVTLPASSASKQNSPSKLTMATASAATLRSWLPENMLMNGVFTAVSSATRTAVGSPLNAPSVGAFCTRGSLESESTLVRLNPYSTAVRTGEF
jgi:hypothetical protein